MNKFEVIERVVDDIKSMDIASIISKYMDLRKRGNSYGGVCPFHSGAKMGNFSVDPHGGIFKCFACNTGGDAIDFVSKLYNLNFEDAVTLIGEDFGLISIDEFNKYFNKDYKAVKAKRPKFVAKKKEQISTLTPKANDDILHLVYSIMLNNLVLEEGHLKHLEDVRRLSEEQIKISGYKSLSSKINRDRLVRGIISDLDKAGHKENILIGVPGFFKEKGRIKMDTVIGLIIPIRNEIGQIVGLQVRRDNKQNGPRYVWFTSSFAVNKTAKQEGGSSPEQSMDITYPLSKTVRKQLIITEGKFKAEILANKWNFVVISVQGVTNWKGISEKIKSIESVIGFKFDSVLTAFDADISFKHQVFEQLKNMTDDIETNLNKSIIYLHWDHSLGKGIDDLIINGLEGKGIINKLSKEIIDRKYEEELNQAIKERAGEELKDIKNHAILETFKMAV